MTWQGKRRKQLPKNWASLRKQRLELDGYRCTAILELDRAKVDEIRRMQQRGDTLGWQRFVLEHGGRCPARATEVDHHLNPDDHRLSSLRSLCHTHHAEKTQREARAAAAKARALNPPVDRRLRPAAKHPGLR